MLRISVRDPSEAAFLRDADRAKQIANTLPESQARGVPRFVEPATGKDSPRTVGRINRFDAATQSVSEFVRKRTELPSVGVTGTGHA